ncbi:MAG: DoxX family protein [Balneolales bacterium]|nr:DoxX family protein [Balneolales bacterium]
MFNITNTFREFGYLIIRVGLGFMIMLHGYPKIMGGPELWANLGGAMGNLGITFAPVFWGFMAAFAEFFGGIFLMLGLFHRISALLLAFTMFVAAVMHIANGDSFIPQIAYPIELGIVFLGLFFMGPRKWALDNMINSKILSSR